MEATWVMALQKTSKEKVNVQNNYVEFGNITAWVRIKNNNCVVFTLQTGKNLYLPRSNNGWMLLLTGPETAIQIS